MLYTQFNLEDAKEVWQEVAYEEGRAEGECKTLILHDFSVPFDDNTCYGLLLIR